MVSERTERLLDRVRKLLALAASPNVHEAALAAMRAQQLIEQHRLEDLLRPTFDVDTLIVDDRAHPLLVARRMRKWKRVLAQQLAALNGCVAYTKKVGREHHIVLVGTDDDRAAVVALWEWLCRRIEWLSATHGQHESKRWHEAFRIGAVQTIMERLKESRDGVQSTLETTALTIVERGLARRTQRVDDFVSENLNLKSGRTIRVDAAAFARGQAAGGEVPLPEA